MIGRRIRQGLCCIPMALFGLCLLPALAGAESRTFLNATHLYPSGGAGDFGPANVFPSRIVISGVKGKVTKATLTLIGYDSAFPDDADVLLSRGSGRRVMLMSDTCGGDPIAGENWTFADAAQTFVPNNGPCDNDTKTSFKPSNYLGEAPEPDDLSPSGGPPPPYTNSLSVFNGISPNGVWSLYALDDSSAFGVGFEIAGWALRLNIRPLKTGQRAAALAKCKKKPSVEARKRCRKRAKKLPV
jgi:hypothetical protein